MFLRCAIQLRRFCSSKKVPEVKPETKNEPAEPYIYAKEKFDLINDAKFIEKLEKMEKSGKFRRTFNQMKFPVLMLGSSLFIYHLWQRMPYGIIFRHTTISEYIPREKYLHAVFIAPLSFQTEGHLIVYFPLLALSSWFTALYMQNRHMLLLYLTTSIITTGVTFAYERYKSKQIGLKMISPKCVGATTPLAFISAFLAINPNYLILNNRMFPFFMIPAFYYMYEAQELYGGYVTELCRPAHVAAIAWGGIFGLIFKKVVLKGII